MNDMGRLRTNRHILFLALLNIAGLTLAFSVFMTVMVQVLYDLRYDRCYQDYEKIYRLESTPPGGSGEFYPVVSRPIIEFVKSVFPQAESIATYKYMKGRSVMLSEADTDTPGVSLRYGVSDHNLLRIFPFKFISGDTVDFGDPRTALISVNGASKLFGNVSPVGKEINFNVKNSSDTYRIVAVYEDFPENSTMDNELLLSIGTEGQDSWSDWSQGCLMKLSSTEGVQEAADSAASYIGKNIFGIGGIIFRVSALHEAHWTKDITSDSIAKGNLATTVVLLSVALIVIFIAAINFINFSMASVPFRIKSINTRRVLGASKTSMVWRQIASAALLALPAFFLATGLVSALASSNFATYISGSLKIADNLPVIAMTVCIVLAVVIVSGTITARYSTSFNPAMVLKGSFSLSARGRRLRTVLVGIQYVISFILILTSMFIAVQNRFMKNYDMGFDRDEVLEVNISKEAASRRETLCGMLMEHPGIIGVTFSSHSIVSTDIGGHGHNYGDEFLMYDLLYVDHGFISFFGLEMDDGRDFLPSDDKRNGSTVIFNRAAMDTYRFLRTDSSLTNGPDNPDRIIGVVKDFNFKPMQYMISPIALINPGMSDEDPLVVMYVRIRPEGVRESMEWIRGKICEADPSLTGKEPDIHFLNETIERLYHNEDRLGRLITVSAVISMIISILGILGLVYFETQFRRKEIALRRVHGASVKEILVMINRYYLSITVTCFIVTAPISIVIIRRWVSSFPYRSPIPVWIFLAALLLILLLTSIAVTVLSHRAALRNPIDSISTE